MSRGSLVALVVVAAVTAEFTQAQMTFTDNWQKKAFIPHVYRAPQQPQAAFPGGTKKSEGDMGFDCSPEGIQEKMSEIRQILLMHEELAQQLATCARQNLFLGFQALRQQSVVSAHTPPQTPQDNSVHAN